MDFPTKSESGKRSDVTMHCWTGGSEDPRVAWGSSGKVKMEGFPCLVFSQVLGRDSNFQNLKTSGVTPGLLLPRGQVLGQSLDTPCIVRDSRCPFHSARGRRGGCGTGGKSGTARRFGTIAFFRSGLRGHVISSRCKRRLKALAECMVLYNLGRTAWKHPRQILKILAAKFKKPKKFLFRISIPHVQ